MIRAATEADAPVIADIQARTWRWAYSDFIADDDMPVAAERVPAWREHIAGGGVRVFDQDGTVVGYSAVQDDELKSLYVDPAAQGAGVGGPAARRRAGADPRGAGTRARGCTCTPTTPRAARSTSATAGSPVGGLVGEAHWRAPGRRYERDL